jgi:NADH-quinone oxidoreductase subunit M
VIPQTSAAAQVGLPLLSILVALPALGAVATLLARTRGAGLAVARFVAGVELAAALVLVAAFEPGRAGFQLVEQHPWIPTLGASWHVGVDGVSVAFVPLTALLGLLVLLSVRERALPQAQGFAAALLVLETALIGIYTSLDLVLFFGFWELSLAPVLLLVALWGDGARRRHAASRTLLTLTAGGVPLVVGLIALANGGSTFTTDLVAILASPPARAAQQLAWPLLLLGFAFKAPIVPLHGWMPEVVAEGPAGVGAITMGLKLGAWALIRFAPACPDAASASAPVLAVLGAIGAVYGALLALRQTDLRRLVAWIGISHVGVVLLGFSTLTVQGLQGALFQLVSFGVVAAGLVLLSGALQARLGSTDVAALGGLSTTMPRLTTAMVALGFGALGLPGTIGFVGEHLSFVGAFAARPWLLLVTLPALPLATGALAGFGARAFGGPVRREDVRVAADLLPGETALAAALVVLLIAGGLVPSALLRLTDTAAGVTVERLTTAVAAPTVDASVLGATAR